MVDFRSEHLTMLEITCFENDVDPHLVDTFFHIESSWNPWAVRYEKAWKYFEKPEENARFLRITLESELACQRMSWGLGQVMGGTSRSYGYTGHITRLIDPETNMEMVCDIINNLEHRYEKLTDVAAAYNAGTARRLPSGLYSNQVYVDKFLKKYWELSAFWQKNSGTKT